MLALFMDCTNIYHWHCHWWLITVMGWLGLLSLHMYLTYLMNLAPHPPEGREGALSNSSDYDKQPLILS